MSCACPHDVDCDLVAHISGIGKLAVRLSSVHARLEAHLMVLRTLYDYEKRHTRNMKADLAEIEAIGIELAAMEP